MALQAAANAPARALAVNALSSLRLENILLPLAQGSARAPGGLDAWFIVTPQPPGPPLRLPGPFERWSEGELLDCVLRPIAMALDRLNDVGMTHRAICPTNVFRARANEALTLGAAWAAPPALHQNAIFEPPYVAMCHPAGRGEGSIADDIYALGVLLLTLAGGRVPLEGMDKDAIIRLKLERGSFVALAGDLRLPATIADLARGMLAEDPEHRPSPALLSDPATARGRRVAARPPQRAQRPLEVGGISVWDARNLSYALARAPDAGIRLLRSQAVETWLRRTLGDPALAGRISETLETRAVDAAAEPTRVDPSLLLRAVALLDPLAPICWRGLCLFPDGIGTVFAQAEGGDDGLTHLQELVHCEAAVAWGETRPERIDMPVLRLDSRQQRLLLRIAGWAGGLIRLRYALNPLLPCRSPLLGPACVVRLGDLLPALERHATASVDFVIDQDIAAFISARFNGRMDAELATLAQTEDPDIDPPGHRGLAQLRVLSRLCTRDGPMLLPRLAACVLRSVQPALATWKSRSVRVAREQALTTAAQRGALPAMLGVMEDLAARQDDGANALAAEIELREIVRSLARLHSARDERVEQAVNTGQEIAASLGIVALAIAAVLSAL